MSYRAVFFLTVAMLLSLPVSTNAGAVELQLWSVDPLIKVFKDALPDGTATASDYVARGEYGEFQLVVRCETPLHDLRVSVTPFTHGTGSSSLTGQRSRFVGYVHVDRPTQRPSQDQLRKPPADYPDVLLEDTSLSVSAGTAQPVWIDIPVPLDAAEGSYEALVTVSASCNGETLEASFPLKLVVYPVTLDKTRLWITNWFSMQWQHMEIDPEEDSEEYYALLRRYARNMAEHNQNVALIDTLDVSHFYIDDAGLLAVDFSRFDRWVQIFIEEGVIGRIEGDHIGKRAGGWYSKFAAHIPVADKTGVRRVAAAADSKKVRNFFQFFYPVFTAHLKEKGWLHIYMQHIGDEPGSRNKKSYERLAALFREFAPDLKIIDATHTTDLKGSLDIWVPQLEDFHKNFAYYQERQRMGEEIWFYTCVSPQGEYANRFIELPLIKTRLLHWINFTSGATGYLHWGYNIWQETDPQKMAAIDHPEIVCLWSRDTWLDCLAKSLTSCTVRPLALPAGDPWIVYPGKAGPLDSIRFEAMRDGIFDHELLCRLAERDPEKARELAERHILDFDRYDTDVENFRATRIALLEALSMTP